MSTVLEMPAMTSFALPEELTIESLKDGLSISPHCYANLTTKNFGVKPQRYGNLKGGFFDMGEKFSFEEGVDSIAQLASKLKRKIYPATPLQALCWISKNLSCPESWAVFGKAYSGDVLCWHRNYGTLGTRRGIWRPRYKIFFVEEPEV